MTNPYPQPRAPGAAPLPVSAVNPALALAVAGSGLLAPSSVSAAGVPVRGPASEFLGSEVRKPCHLTLSGSLDGSGNYVLTSAKLYRCYFDRQGLKVSFGEEVTVDISAISATTTGTYVVYFKIDDSGAAPAGVAIASNQTTGDNRWLDLAANGIPADKYVRAPIWEITRTSPKAAWRKSFDWRDQSLVLYI